MPVFEGRRSVNSFSRLTADIVDDYFLHLNSTAQRIAIDIKEAKISYGQLWYTFSENEQNLAINDEIIKPGLTLKYFDNMDATSLKSTSSSSSLLSTAENIFYPFKNVVKSASVDSLNAACIENKTPKLANKLMKCKNANAYDGQNLRTFSRQKVALKIIQGELLGAYRDEHSMPFSFRTKSQISLRIFDLNDNVDSTNVNTGQIKTFFFSMHDQQKKPKSEKLYNNQAKIFFNKDHSQNGLKIHNAISNNVNKKVKKENRLQATNTDFLQNFNKSNASKMCVTSAANVSTAFKNIAKNNAITITTDKSSFKGKKNKDLVKALLEADAHAMTTPITYAIYSDGYFDHEESLNLMQHCSSNAVTILSSSVATSDEDRTDFNDGYDDDDEKTLCEDVQLLENEISLRRGFDFLNNW